MKSFSSPGKWVQHVAVFSATTTHTLKDTFNLANMKVFWDPPGWLPPPISLARMPHLRCIWKKVTRLTLPWCMATTLSVYLERYHLEYLNRQLPTSKGWMWPRSLQTIPSRSVHVRKICIPTRSLAPESRNSRLAEKKGTYLRDIISTETSSLGAGFAPCYGLNQDKRNLSQIVYFSYIVGIWPNIMS